MADATTATDVVVFTVTAEAIARILELREAEEEPSGPALRVEPTATNRTAYASDPSLGPPAAAEEAVRRIDAEIAVTRRRLRALEKHWLPSLLDALAALELSLEQAEQDDGTRLRRAATGQPDRRPPP